MNTDESEILFFLRSWPNEYFSAKEIARRVGSKKRYRECPLWAKPALRLLMQQSLVEKDEMGHYRLAPEKPKRTGRKFLSPQIREILEKSGQNFGEDIDLELTTESDDL